MVEVTSRKEFVKLLLGGRKVTSTAIRYDDVDRLQLSKWSDGYLVLLISPDGEVSFACYVLEREPPVNFADAAARIFTR